MVPCGSKIRVKSSAGLFFCFLNWHCFRMRFFLPLDASGTSCNGQNSADPTVKRWFLRCRVFQAAINICAKTSPKCPTKASQKRQKSEKRTLWAGLQKTSLLSERTCWQMCSKRTSNEGASTVTSGLTFERVFGPGWHVPPRPPQNVIYYTI